MILLYITCSFLIISSIFVVTSKNALHSILFLVASFIFSAFTIFFLENEFLALFFLIIYLGAIVILFLFVVMMLDLKHNLISQTKAHFPTGFFIGIFSFLYIKHVIELDFKQPFLTTKIFYQAPYYVNWQNMLDNTTDILSIAMVFYHNYAAQILISGVLLYITVIGVVFLTSSNYKRSTEKASQSLTKQLSRRGVL